MRKEDSDAAEGLSEVMHWGCLEHWMWPLYTDRWTPLREQLGLPDLSSDATATPLLYLFSPLLVEPSSYWPRSVKVCGYVSPSSPPRAARDGNEQPVDSLMKLLRQFMAAGERPLYVGFGSMSLMGEQAAATVRRLGIAAQQAATELSLRVILHGSDCGSTRSHPNVSVFLLEGSVPHDWLFRQCLAAVHHGGSGTTHAVTKAGIPHIICPQHFDQLYWGETIDHKKLGAVLHKCQYVRGDGPDGHVSVAALADRLKACIERAVTPQTRLRCACLGKKLREEGGTARTIEMIMQVMQDSEQGNLSNASAPHTPEASWHEKVASAPGLALLELPDNLEVAIVEGSKEEVAHIWSELFVEDCYRRSGLVINDGDVVLDVGANIGLFCVWALLSTDEGDLRLYAFEPSSSNSAVTPSVQALGMNLSRFSSATSSHHLEPVAVSDCCGEDGQFCFFPNMPGNSCLRRYREGKQAQGDASINPSIAPRLWEGERIVDSCPLRTLSWAIRKHGLERIDVLKVDVEGSELDVLRGVEAAHWGIIKQVVAEVHNEANRVEDVKELLRSNGFEVSQLDLQLLEASRAPAQCLIYGRSVPGSILH
ncbi:unnamed protein product [Chrysoparadoxa australica]